MSLEVGFFWLLLPLAALSGWYYARRSQTRITGVQVDFLRSSYFRGLNYLLNEQSDKAIEVFLKIAELDSDTVEAHLALGSLFRRRGEVDRAIRVHQNLIARPSMSAEQKKRAIVELGEDYMRAGLLDRAEALFSDLVQNGEHSALASKHLIAIYQQEREWLKAIEQAKYFELSSKESQSNLIAHYFCELAEQAMGSKDITVARGFVDQAFLAEPGFPRGLIVCARVAIKLGDLESAASAFEKALERDVELVPEVLASLLECYEKLAQPHRAKNNLKLLCERYEGISPVLAVTRMIEREQGEKKAEQFLGEHLRCRPSVRGLTQWLELKIKLANEPLNEFWIVLHGYVHNLLDGKSGYRCSRCGFGARAHHWQCPSCKSWGAIKPVHGVMGD